MRATAKPDRQQGFTLIELMIASSIALAVLLPTFLMFYGTIDALTGMAERNAVNRQARQAMTLLGEGAVNTVAGPGSDGTNNVDGLRSQKDALSSPYQDYRVRLSGNSLEALSDEVPETTIRCTGPGTPLKDCSDASDTVNVKGWIDQQTLTLESSSRTVGGRTTELEFNVFHPGRLKRKSGRPEAYVERYRSIFTRNRDDF